MSDRLERMIRQKRSEFDEFEPPAGLWEKIEKQLDGQPVKPLGDRVVRLSIILKIAAALFIVVSAGIFLVKTQEARAMDISRISPEMGKMQVQYASMIESRRAEIRQVAKNDPYLYNEFSSAIGKMDMNYQKLKSELPDSPNQEETVKAMIRNLQTQLDMLNQQLTIIEQIKQIKKEQNNGKQII